MNAICYVFIKILVVSLNWQKIYEELEKLRERIRSASKEPTYGLHRKKQMPFFRMFDRELIALHK